MTEFTESTKVLAAVCDTLDTVNNREHYIRDYIIDNPKQLGLGDVECVNKEVVNQNGRMDIKLIDKDNTTHYNVELQLGDADPSHIFRTLAYYKSQQRVYPFKKHYAVLIAEAFNSKWSDVLYMLGESIPFIAIKMDVIKMNGAEGIIFNEHLNTYTEPEVKDNIDTYGVDYWKQYSPHTYKASMKARDFFGDGLSFAKDYIAIKANNNNHLCFHHRKEPITSIQFIRNEEMEKMITEFKVEPSSLTLSKNGQTYYNIKAERIDEYMELLLKLHNNKLQNNGK